MSWFRMAALLAAAASVLVLSAAERRVQEFSVPSKVLGRARKVWVYTPEGYAASSPRKYGLVICFDGTEYVEDIPVPSILDQLAASGKLPPLVAVMVDNSESRLDDLANSRKFARFLAEDLVPWVRGRWSVSDSARDTVITGSSAGGLASAYAAYRHPGIFGNVLSQSGAFWRGNEGTTDEYEWLTKQFAAAPRRETRFYMDVGSTETRPTLGRGPSILDTNRRLSEVLRTKGYDVSYHEIPGGTHSPDSWKKTIADGLIYLMGSGGAQRAN